MKIAISAETLEESVRVCETPDCPNLAEFTGDYEVEGKVADTWSACGACLVFVFQGAADAFQAIVALGDLVRVFKALSE